MTTRLRRSNDSINVWTTKTKDALIPFDAAGNLETADLPFAAGADELTVWVEWASAAHGTAEVTLVSSVDQTDVDKLMFHTFQSIVVAFGGDDQNPSDPPDDNHGAFNVAVDLYREGYDVHMYNEEDVTAAGQPPRSEVVGAIQDRGVTEVAILGYSHGGGATYVLSKQLDDDRGQIGTFTIEFTAYIDAVEHYGLEEENRRPKGTQYSLNIHQDNWIHELGGGPLNDPQQGDEEINVTSDAGWDHSLDHFDIDDDDDVRTRVKVRLRENIGR